MTDKARVTRKDPANDASHLRPGYKAGTPYPLFTLPAELRMQIYGYVLITPLILRIERQIRAVLGSD